MSAFVAYSNYIKPLGLCIPYVCILSIISKLIRYYPLKSNNEYVTVKLRKSFIILLVFTLLLCIGECLVYVMVNGFSAGVLINMIAKNWLAFFLISIAGILLTRYSRILEREKIKFKDWL